MLKGKWKLILIAIAIALLVGSFAPVFDDPYHKEGKVNFWLWLWREIDELVHGEKD